MPILVVWFGIGTVPAILTAFLIHSSSPIVVNVANGSRRSEPELEDVLRYATRYDDSEGRPAAFAPVQFRVAQGAITLAFVGTIVSETVAANEGSAT